MSTPKDVPARSSRDWIVGVGHVPLAEARRWAVERVEQAELVVLAADAHFRAAWVKLQAASGESGKARDKLDDAKRALVRARDDLAYRMGESDG